MSQGNWLQKHARGLLRRLLNVTSYELSVESKLFQMLNTYCQEDWSRVFVCLYVFEFIFVVLCLCVRKRVTREREGR